MHRIFTLSALLLVCGCFRSSDFRIRPDAKPVNSVLPPDWSFWWGVSSSSYQTEDQGPPEECLGFKTEWDIAHDKGFIKTPRGDGVWSYTLVDRDIAMMRKLGITHYRFSVEWARIEPRPGEFNEAAIAHYVKMVKQLRAAGITPLLTLWHFTFPAWLSADTPDHHGWLHPHFQSHWEPYVRKVVTAMAGEVQFYAPENEPNIYALGQLTGELPPGGGRASYSRYLKTLLIEADAFNQAARIIRQIRPDAKIVTIENIVHWKIDAFDWGQFWYKKALEFNYYHLDRVIGNADFIGVNYYFSEVASPLARLAQSLRSGEGVSDLGWIIDPAGLESAIGDLSRRYGKPMLITENGIADQTDMKRQRYIQDHIAAIRRSISAGHDVRGYFYWTMIDNFEWMEGYGPKFGLCTVSPTTHELIEKPSFETFRAIVAKRDSAIR